MGFLYGLNNNTGSAFPCSCSRAMKRSTVYCSKLDCFRGCIDVVKVPPFEVTRLLACRASAKRISKAHQLSIFLMLQNSIFKVYFNKRKIQRLTWVIKKYREVTDCARLCSEQATENRVRTRTCDCVWLRVQPRTALIYILHNYVKHL